MGSSSGELLELAFEFPHHPLVCGPLTTSYAGFGWPTHAPAVPLILFVAQTFLGPFCAQAHRTSADFSAVSGPKRITCERSRGII
jgi:hypothetical protein